MKIIIKNPQETNKYLLFEVTNRHIAERISHIVLKGLCKKAIYETFRKGSFVKEVNSRDLVLLGTCFLLRGTNVCADLTSPKKK